MIDYTPLLPTWSKPSARKISRLLNKLAEIIVEEFDTCSNEDLIEELQHITYALSDANDALTKAVAQ